MKLYKCYGMETGRVFYVAAESIEEAKSKVKSDDKLGDEPDTLMYEAIAENVIV